MFGPIRTLCLAAGLYLPLALFIWFAFSAGVVLPVLWLVKMILLNWMPEVFVDVERNQYLFAILTLLVNDPELLKQAQAGQQVVAEFSVNPMIYGYGLPVIAGLAMATPNSAANRAKQIALGAVVIWLVQVNGVIWDVLQYVNSSLIGGHDAIVRHHLSSEFLAAMYQFGYLILPPLTPVIFWALMNRRFIDDLIKLDHIQTLEEFAEIPKASTNDPKERAP
jgi:hypothetical protein